jgi:hypothetical protein
VAGKDVADGSANIAPPPGAESAAFGEVGGNREKNL